jgi:hypothetical protein
MALALFWSAHCSHGSCGGSGSGNSGSDLGVAIPTSGTCCISTRGLVSRRAVPRFHRNRRHPYSPGRGRDRSCDDNKEPNPHHDRGAETCFDGREREGGREGNRWLVDSRARSFPGLHGDHDDPQEDDQDPRESLQNMDLRLKAGRIPCFRLLSRRRWVRGRLGPLAQSGERHDPGDLAVERPPRALVRSFQPADRRPSVFRNLLGLGVTGAVPTCSTGVGGRRRRARRPSTRP